MKLFSILSLSLLTLIAITKTAPTQDATSLRLAIGREKVNAFSKDYLIKSGLEQKDLEKWESVVKTGLNAASSQKEALLPNADRLFYTLDNAYAFITTTIKKLNTLYASGYVKEAGKYVPAFKDIMDAELIELARIKKEAEALRIKTLEVQKAAFPQDFLDKQPTPESWVQAYLKDEAGKLKSAEALFPGYETFLKEYKEVNQSYPLFIKKYGKKYGLASRDEKSYAALLEKIERCDYRLSQKKISTFEKKNRALLQDFARTIRKAFPHLLTSLDFYKIGRSTSLQRTVLSAYAEAMEGVLNQVIREVTNLIEAMKTVQK